MISRRFLLLLLPVLTLSCAAPPGPPVLPTTARTIAVLPPNNRTGDPLLVESASFLHPYADRPGRITVADALLSEGESSCFYHPNKRAVVPCDQCGRFLCTLCRVDFGQRVL